MIFEADGELVRHAASYGCDTIVLPRQSCSADDRASEFVAPLAEILSVRRPEVTVFWSPRAQLYGSRAHQAAGCPGRTAWVQHVIPSDFWLHRDASMSPTDLVVCVSSAVQRQQRRLYPHNPTRVVHPGIDPPPASLSQEAARARLGRDPVRPLIGLVGRVEPWKGQDLALRMLAVLAEWGVDADMILLGQRHSPTWPEFHAEVDRLIHELGLVDRVTFVGHRGDVRALASALDVLVCASREEGFGLAVLEAVASGVPVVASRCGGPEDIIEHGITGQLVPVEDPTALADAVQRVLRQPRLAARLAIEAKRVWQERFTATRSACEFRATVSDVADGQLPPRVG